MPRGRKGGDNDYVLDILKADLVLAARFRGYFTADGNVRLRGKASYEISLRLARVDRGLLENWRQLFHLKAQINDTENGAGKLVSQLQFHSPRLGRCLVDEWGIRPRKSFVISDCPRLTGVELSHYAGGYFDGDGSVGCYHGTTYIRFLGQQGFLEGLRDLLVGELGIKRTEIVPHSSIFSIGWGCRRDINLLTDFIYPEGDYPCLGRKRNLLRGMSR